MRGVNKKVLGFALASIFLSMLAAPMVSAKPTIKSVDFRIESWPAPMDSPDYDWSKFKSFPAGESGNSKIIRIPILGVPPLIDDVPDPTFPVWLPYMLAHSGGVRLTIDGMGTIEGTVEQMVIHTNSFADGSWSASEKWTFTFDDGTLEVSANSFKNGMGRCVGTRGTGIFEGAKFTGTFEANLYWYVIPDVANVGFKIQEGTGEIMFT